MRAKRKEAAGCVIAAIGVLRHTYTSSHTERVKACCSAYNRRVLLYKEKKVGWEEEASSMQRDEVSAEAREEAEIARESADPSSSRDQSSRSGGGGGGANESHDGTIQLKVRTMEGIDHLVRVKMDDKVSALKKAVQESTGAAEADQRLIYNGRAMKNEQFVRELGALSFFFFSSLP